VVSVVSNSFASAPADSDWVQHLSMGGLVLPECSELESIKWFFRCGSSAVIGEINLLVIVHSFPKQNTFRYAACKQYIQE
jgi:hypothetical protein